MCRYLAITNVEIEIRYEMRTKRLWEFFGYVWGNINCPVCKKEMVPLSFEENRKLFEDDNFNNVCLNFLPDYVGASSSMGIVHCPSCNERLLIWQHNPEPLRWLYGQLHRLWSMLFDPDYWSEEIPQKWLDEIEQWRKEKEKEK